MRPNPHRFLFCALAVLGASQSLPAQAKVSSKELDNGLQVYVATNPAAAFVSLELVLRAGANVQTDAKDAGLAHVLEHMLFRRGASGSVDTELSKIDGVGMNGVTDAETVRYYFSVPPKNVGAGIDLLAKMTRRPTWAKAALDDEKLIVRGELERNASEPDFHLHTESSAALWGDAAWTIRSPGGNLVAIQEATIDRLKALYERYYVPNNAALVVAGAVTDTEVFELAAKAFGSWKKGADPFAGATSVAIKPLAAVQRKVMTGDVSAITYLIRWQGPGARKDPAHTFAADVFSGLVNQPLSRMQKRLVDAGVADGFSLGYDTYGDVGVIELTVRTTEERAAATTRMIGEEIAALSRADFFGEDDLTTAKKRQQVLSHFLTESASAATVLVSEFWGAAGPTYHAGYEAGLAAQGLEDVKRFAQTYITGKPYTVVVMVPRFAPPAVRTSIETGLARWGAAR